MQAKSSNKSLFGNPKDYQLNSRTLRGNNREIYRPGRNRGK